MTFIGLFWKQIAIAIIIAGLLGAIKIEQVRITHAQDEISSQKLTIDGYARISDELKLENARIDEGSKKATLITVNSYESKLKKLGQYYENHPNPIVELHDGGVLPSATDSSTTSKTEVSDTTTRIDEEKPYIPTIKECAVTTLMLDELQGWIVNQEEVFK